MDMKTRTDNCTGLTFPSSVIAVSNEISNEVLHFFKMYSILIMGE